MKILLVSDSHGKKEYLNALIDSAVYDYVFFAGDGLRDLGVNIYDPKFAYVKGNCDFFSTGEPITQTQFIDNIKILVTHGDYFKVKYGLEQLQAFAESKGYNLVCFGHTHHKMQLNVNGINYVNAGSLKNGDYAEIIIKEGKIKVEFKNINTKQVI